MSDFINEIRELIGRDRSTEYVLSREECIDIIALLKQKVNTAVDEINVAGVCNPYHIKDKAKAAIKNL